MTDVVDSKTRSRMMSGIRGRDTLPELVIRKGLHAKGFRYRLHDKKLPGKPDLVFPRFNAVVFVHGCFWHGHDCHLFKWPKTRDQFWKVKIERNRTVDKAVQQKLCEDGWRVMVIWECAIKGKFRKPLAKVLRATSEWLVSRDTCCEIRGAK